MNIKELLSSTATVAHYGGDGDSFKSKPFGAVFFYNKTVVATSNTITITMKSKAVTDKIQASSNTPPRAVAAHNTVVRIYNANLEIMTDDDELVETIRTRNETYKSEKDYPKEWIIEKALENSVKFFEGKSIMRGGKNPWNYTIVDDVISDEAEIRVWCSCSAYYWAFQYYNCENGVDVFGNYPERYTYKTKKGFEAFRANQPMRNPGRKPGCCKHVLMLLALLMDKGEASTSVIQATGSSSLDVLNGYKLNMHRFSTTKKLSEKQERSLLNKYASDHESKRSQRKLNRETIGFAAGAKGGFWSKRNKWVPPKNGRAGYWKKR